MSSVPPVAAAPRPTPAEVLEAPFPQTNPLRPVVSILMDDSGKAPVSLDRTSDQAR